MKKRLEQKSIAFKLNAIIGLASLGVLSLVYVQATFTKTNLMESKQEKLLNITEVAQSIIEHEYASFKDGKISEDVAKKQAYTRISNLRYDNGNYFWINDMKQVIVMHAVKPELNGKDLTDLKDPNGKQLFVAFVEKVKAEGAGYVDYLWPKPGAEEPQPKLSYVAGFKPWGWVVGTGVYVDDVNAQFIAKLQHLLLIAGAIILAMASAGYALARSIKKRVSAITQSMQALSEGNTEHEIPFINDSDEVGFMARALNIFRENALERKNLEAKQDEFKAQSEADKRAALQKMLDEYQRQVGQVVEQITQACQSVEHATQELSENAQGTRTQAGESSHMASNSSNNVSALAASSEEMTATITEISQQINEAAQIAAGAVKNVEDTGVIMSELTKASEQIGDIASMISGIAEQTNLLALNATIEAARAGEAGKGFAVVASEVKALATQTSSATQSIADQITAIQGAANQSVDAMNTIGTIIGRLNDITTTVASAVEEQSITSRDISTHIQSAAEASNGLSEAMSNIMQTIDSDNQTILHMAEQVSELQNKIKTMKQSSDTFIKTIEAA